jgi:polysaccharide pyruvyl transferase WcaK-like protein
MKTIWVENSTWNNIGDGFYQSSLVYQLRKLFPRVNIVEGDGPMLRTFRPSRHFEKNVFEAMNFQTADAYVFSGPMLRQLWWRYESLIKRLHSEGKPYFIFSASAADASEQDCIEIERFFKKYPPAALSLRDNEQYEFLKGIVPNAISSICLAFLMGELPVAEVDYKTPYIVSSFYKNFEPNWVKPAGNELPNIEETEPINQRAFTLLRHFEWLKPGPKKVGNYAIIRVRHETTCSFSHLMFRKSNSYCSMNPLVILSIYKGAELVVSDRVHACVAGLSMGKVARLIVVDKRANLFKQHGIVDFDEQGFMRLNQGNFAKARETLLNYISASINQSLKS